jgi:hypothetical protein
MKPIKSDDPVLTAYVLGELAKEQREQVADELARDVSLDRKRKEIEAVCGLLQTTLEGGGLTLGEERIAEIHRAGQRPDPKVIVLEHRKRARRHTLLAVAGVAAAVVLGLALLSRSRVGSGGSVSGSEVAGGGSMESQRSGATTAMPSIMKSDHHKMVGLPTRLGRADPAMIERTLLETGALPRRDQFQVAEWVNFSRLAPENSTTEEQWGNLRVSSELGRCSWDPSKALLMIHLQPLRETEIDLKAALELDPELVREVRLMGGEDEESRSSGDDLHLAEPRTYLYELALIDESGRFGDLVAQFSDQESHRLALTGPVREKDEVSLTFATTRLLGNFARWGASEERDRESLVRMSREAKRLLEQITDAQTRYALDMILITEERLAAE